jgi:hypothetical protein
MIDKLSKKQMLITVMVVSLLLACGLTMLGAPTPDEVEITVEVKEFPTVNYEATTTAESTAVAEAKEIADSLWCQDEMALALAEGMLLAFRDDDIERVESTLVSANHWLDIDWADETSDHCGFEVYTMTVALGDNIAYIHELEDSGEEVPRAVIERTAIAGEGLQSAVSSAYGWAALSEITIKLNNE